MSLSADQLAFEHAVLDSHRKTVESNNLEEILKCFTDDAVITTDKGVFTGHAAIRAYFQGMLDLLRIIRIKPLKTTFDPAQNLIFELFESTIVLKADPERKEVAFVALAMAEKPLGSGATKVTASTRFASTEVVAERVAYLKSLQAKA